MTAMMSKKRAQEDDESASSERQGDAHVNGSSPTNPHEDQAREEPRKTKRSRTSRWENTESDKTTSGHHTAPSKNALSEIVKKLSNVVKEKSAPLNPVAAAPSAHGVLNAGLSATLTGGPIDAATAKAKALAQASLLSMNLPTAQVSANDLARRLYIGNLYYELKEDDIRNTFAPFGSIQSIDLAMEPGCTRSKGFCFLEYDDVLAAEAAVQVLNGIVLANRAIRVGRPLRGNASNDATQALSIGQEAIRNVSTKCIYVGGVRVELNSHHLESIFSPFGEINACVMTAVSPLESGMHRGYGFLEFTDESSAMNAIQNMHGFELAGQSLRVGKASPAAILINLTTSKDKIVRGGGHATTLGGLSAVTAPKKSLLDDDEDYEGGQGTPDEKRCLCLLNLVNKGEVDDELEEEVHLECKRHGQVEQVSIQELVDHVRVFVVFKDPSGAQKAMQALNGRFFGGNPVKVHIYPLSQLQQKNYEAALV